MARLTRRELLSLAGLAAAGLVGSCSAEQAPAPHVDVSPSARRDLEKALRGSIVRPGDADYAELATPRNLRFAATMPEAVVRCAVVEDVAAAVAWARKTHTPFAAAATTTRVHRVRAASSSPSAR